MYYSTRAHTKQSHQMAEQANETECTRARLANPKNEHLHHDAQVKPEKSSSPSTREGLGDNNSSSEEATDSSVDDAGARAAQVDKRSSFDHSQGPETTSAAGGGQEENQHKLQFVKTLGHIPAYKTRQGSTAEVFLEEVTIKAGLRQPAL